MSTTVVHKRLRHDVFIGRPSKWGNPFAVGRAGINTRDQAITAYREWVIQQPDLLAALGEIRGKKLGCYCHPLPCHGDVLAELADATPFSDILG